tara:strand:+ start:165 stop:3089 length:2925 start_codon:yes stop_codon:yes gene_type:complete
MASTIQQIETPKRARALDTSGNNNHGQIYSGRALEFDGVVDQLNTSLVFKSTTHTFAAWIKVNDTATNKVIIDTRDGDDDGIVFFVDTAERIRVTLNDTTTTGNTSVVDRWVRVVATYDGSTANIYVNGVLDKTASVSETFDTTTTLTIGERSYSGTNYFDGLMSDVQVWNATWSADDVAYDYLNPESLALNRSGTSLTNSNLKLWYPTQGGHRGNQSYVLDASNTGLGDEMITNGDFSNGTTGWSLDDNTEGSESISVNGSNQLVIASGSEAGQYGVAVQAINTVAGTTYRVGIDILKVHCYACGDGANYIRMGTNINADFQSMGATTNIIENDSSFLGVGNVIYFTATANHTHIGIGARNDITEMIVDNISVKAVNDKSNATTVFLGDELIASDAADNRTFDNDTGNWAVYDGAGNTTAIANVGNKLQVTTTADNADEGATLAIAHIGDGSTTSIVAGKSYRVSVDLDLTTPSSGTFAMRMTLAGHTIDAFNITTTETTYTKDFIAVNNTDGLFIYNISGTNTVFTVDNVSVKEIGLASGWTDADQQLHIPQTALQSYNELAWCAGGNENVQVNALAANLGTNNFVISYVIHVEKTTGDFNRFLSFEESSNTGRVVHSIVAGGLYIYIEETGSDGTGKTFVAASAVGALVNGNTYHIVESFDRTSNLVTTYINGKATGVTIDMSSYSGDDIDCNGRLSIYQHASTEEMSIQGFITEVALWKNTTFNADKVNELYNDGKPLDALTHSESSTLYGYWRNNGLNTWVNLKDPGTKDSTSNTMTETILIPQGIDKSRDSQGFIMNRQKDASSLNLTNGSDSPYVDLGSTTTIADNAAASFVVWIKPEDVSTNYILSNGGSEDYIRIESHVAMTFRAGGTSGEFDMASGDVAAGKWSHIAFVRAANDVISLYIDGKLNGDAGTDTETINTEFDYRYIGGLLTNTFRGKINGFLAYNDELSITEVQRNYNATKGSHIN